MFKKKSKVEAPKVEPKLIQVDFTHDVVNGDVRESKVLISKIVPKGGYRGSGDSLFLSTEQFVCLQKQVLANVSDQALYDALGKRGFKIDVVVNVSTDRNILDTNKATKTPPQK